MMKKIASKLALGSVVLGSLVVMACASDADIAKVQGNQNGSSSGATTASATTQPTPTATTTATPVTDGGTVDAGPNCNTLTEEGQGAEFTLKHLPALVATGGTIVDGVYVLDTEALYDDHNAAYPYDTPISVPRKWTMEIRGNMMWSNIGGTRQTVQIGPGSGPTKYSTTVLCHSTQPGAPFAATEHDYSATPNSFTDFTYTQGGGGDTKTEIWVWKKIR